MAPEILSHITYVLDKTSEIIKADGRPVLLSIENANAVHHFANQSGIPICGGALHMVGNVPTGQYLYLEH